MESLNTVVLAGKVESVEPIDERKPFRFNLVTQQMYFEGNNKMWDSEVHSMKLSRHSTISKYIKPGKNMVVSGRLKYCRDAAYILVDVIHFPGVDNE